MLVTIMNELGKLDRTQATKDQRASIPTDGKGD